MDRPHPGFTLEENLADLERHQHEFLAREAFAYTVVSHDESRVLGCLYINPSADESVDAVIHMWVRTSEFRRGMDPILSALSVHGLPLTGLLVKWFIRGGREVDFSLLDGIS